MHCFSTITKTIISANDPTRNVDNTTDTKQHNNNTNTNTNTTTTTSKLTPTSFLSPQSVTRSLSNFNDSTGSAPSAQNYHNAKYASTRTFTNPFLVPSDRIPAPFQPITFLLQSSLLPPTTDVRELLIDAENRLGSNPFGQNSGFLQNSPKVPSPHNLAEIDINLLTQPHIASRYLPPTPALIITTTPIPNPLASFYNVAGDSASYRSYSPCQTRQPQAIPIVSSLHKLYYQQLAVFGVAVPTAYTKIPLQTEIIITRDEVTLAASLATKANRGNLSVILTIIYISKNDHAERT
jgi:hypothetical protein